MTNKIDPARPMYRAPLIVRAIAAQALAAVVPARPYALWNSIDALDAYPHEAQNATAADRADARARLLVEAENMRARKWTAYELNYIDAAETLAPAMTNQLPAAPHQVELPKLSQEIRDFSEIIARKGAALDRAPFAYRANVYFVYPTLDIWPLDPAARKDNPAARHTFYAIWGYTAVEHLAAYLLTIAPRADWK